ncbi:unnamed protein product, partial [marine sediment metagenome]
GEIVAEGPLDKIINADTLTCKYISGRLKIDVPDLRREVSNCIA